MISTPKKRNLNSDFSDSECLAFGIFFIYLAKSNNQRDAQ